MHIYEGKQAVAAQIQYMKNINEFLVFVEGKTLTQQHEIKHFGMASLRRVIQCWLPLCAIIQLIHRNSQTALMIRVQMTE